MLRRRETMTLNRQNNVRMRNGRDIVRTNWIAGGVERILTVFLGEWLKELCKDIFIIFI